MVVVDKVKAEFGDRRGTLIEVAHRNLNSQTQQAGGAQPSYNVTNLDAVISDDAYNDWFVP